MVSLFVSVVIHPVEGDSPIPYDGPGGTLLDDTSMSGGKNSPWGVCIAGLPMLGTDATGMEG